MDRFDNRYLTFLTTLINSDGNFPDEVKIISWNYDFQMQDAADKFWGKEESCKQFKCFPSVSIENLGNKVETNSELNSIYEKHFKNINLVQLNGIAGLIRYSENNMSALWENMDINNLLEKFQNSNNEIHLLTFAWEEELVPLWIWKERLKYTIKIIEDTDFIVVIGYSFPFFNREIDKLIFDALKGGPLKKIYFQDPDPNRLGEFLRTQLDLPKKDKLEIIDEKYCEQFFVPYEL